VLGFLGRLPLQAEQQIRYFSIHDVVEHTFKDRTPGLKACAKLDRDVYPHKIPPEISITVCRLEVIDGWSVPIIRLVGLSRAEGKEVRKRIWATGPVDPSAGEYKVLWPKPPQDDAIESYELEIYLRAPRSASETEIASADRLITEGKGIIAFDPRLQ
jgi:hypothetical protein